MASPRKPDRLPIWQAALIVLPVAILAGTALYFLREDRAAIEREARERVAAAAPELVRRVGERLAALRTAGLHGEIAGGRILSPPEHDPVPVPADWPARLTPVQAELWRTAQSALHQRQDASGARLELTQFAGSGVAAEARANAEYWLLLTEGKQAAGARYLDLARRSVGMRTESGAPLAELALMRAGRSTPAPDGFLAELRRSVLEHPSFLTAELLEAAPDRDAVRGLRDTWVTQERMLGLMRVLLRNPPAAGQADARWMEAEGAAFAIFSSLAARGWRVSGLPEAQVRKAVGEAIAAERSRLPAYAGVRVEIAGRRVAGRGAPVLAASGGDGFTLSIELADAARLYAGYRRRMGFTAALIVSAAATALVGLVILWQGMRRQARLNQMKSNFVSSVSHELRAPIGAVRLMAESLQRGTAGGEAKQKEYFRLIVQECRRLSRLVENVLDVSRMESGRKPYRFEPVDVTALVRHAAALMEPVAAERGIGLTVAGSEGLRPMWDPEAVEQSLVNLLDNAIQHSPEGAAVRLDVESAGAGERIRIWVSDSGGGLPQEEHARIFDLFYRRGDELRRETKGAGIGLSIVKHVAEAHGGRVLVESEVGKGSRFGLELPVEQA